jgi:DNA-binding Lrp family transcriptional regulator
MSAAFLLLSTVEFDPQMLKELRSLKGVEYAHSVYGVYDIVVKTKAESMNTLKAVHDKIRKLKGVKSTLTIIAHEE